MRNEYYNAVIGRPKDAMLLSCRQQRGSVISNGKKSRTSRINDRLHTRAAGVALTMLLAFCTISCFATANNVPTSPMPVLRPSPSSSSRLRTNKPTTSKVPATPKPSRLSPSASAVPSSTEASLQKTYRALTSSPTSTPFTRYLGSSTAPTPTADKTSSSSARTLFKDVYLVTTISNFQPMAPDVTQIWQDVTTNWVLDYWSKTQRVTKLSLDTSVIKQDPPYATSGNSKRQQQKATSGRRARRQRQLVETTLVQETPHSRSLQTPEVTLFFKQNVNYQVPAGVTDYPPPDSISTEPFATFALRSEYIASLMNASSAFQNITTVSQFKVTSPPPAPPKKPWYAQVADQPIILGAVGGGILLCIIVIFIICICRGRKGRDATVISKNDPRGIKNDNNNIAMNGGAVNSPKVISGHHYYSQEQLQQQQRRSRDVRMDSYIEIRNERADDISTLGDPLSPYDKNWLMRQRLNTDASTKASEQEKTVGPSIINDFDYTKTFGGKFDTTPDETPNVYSAAKNSAYNSSSSNKEKVNIRASAVVSPISVDQQSVTSDGSFDQAFEAPEERIVVMAPPGKLGVVIDTFDNGEPGVNSIREDSVLRSQLRVGDVLVEFDGIDTTEMTALQVSTLIGEKSKNPVRTLVFMRNRN